MTKFFLGSVALAALTAAGPAWAADMWVKAPYKDPWSWTGPYVGLNAGYSWGRSGTTETLTNSVTGAVLATFTESVKLPGGLVGIQVGHNWQLDRIVLGIEADLQRTNERGNTSVLCPAGVCNPAINGPVTGTFDQRLSWFGTVRGRLGVTGSPVMAYVTGGLAFGEVNTDVSLAGINNVGGRIPVLVPVSSSFTSQTTKTGWTLGGGVEGRLWGNWTGKIEYLYVDLGTVSGGPFTTALVNGGGFINAAFNSRITDNILRFGVNYKLPPGGR